MRPRLLTPLLMTELNKMISLRNNNNNNLDPLEAQRQLLRVRKNLFGRANHEDSRAFAEKELQAMSETLSAKWNFDFMNEKPLDTPNPRYIWEKVSPQESVPESYALKRFPYLSTNSVLIENNERININNNIVMEEDEFKPLDRISHHQTKDSMTLRPERQTQITEFMKYSRKRRISASKVTDLMQEESEPCAKKRSRSLNTLA